MLSAERLLSEQAFHFRKGLVTFLSWRTSLISVKRSPDGFECSCVYSKRIFVGTAAISFYDKNRWHGERVERRVVTLGDVGDPHLLPELNSRIPSSASTGSSRSSYSGN